MFKFVKNNIMKKTYKNRYGDIFTFTLQDDGNVLWEGNFKYCRFGMPNDYEKAWSQYVLDNYHLQDLLTREQFEEEVHRYDDETNQYVYDKYVRMVESIEDKIDMLDASGGPYIAVGMSLSSFGFNDLKVKDFVQEDNGFLIVTEIMDF
jgi:hypothetical protein